MALLKESLNFLNFLPSHTRGQRFLAFTRPPDFWRCQVGTSEYPCLSNITMYLILACKTKFEAHLLQAQKFAPVAYFRHGLARIQRVLKNKKDSIC
jgi:hypothetical protein